MHETIEIWGDGNNVRDYIFIDDVCKMLYALIDYHGEIEVFNLSSNTGTSQNDVINILRQITPDVAVKYLPARTVDAKKIVLDNGRISSICKIPLVSPEEGIRRYFEYIQKRM